MGIFQRLENLFSKDKIKDILSLYKDEDLVNIYCNTRSPVHGELPTERRGCVDCKYLKSYASWWCTNEKASLARGTRIPGVIHCPHWELDTKYAIEIIKSHKNDHFNNTKR